MTDQPDPYLAQWRARILQNTLVATAMLAAIAYVPSMIVSGAMGLVLLQVVDTILVALIVGLAVGRRLPFVWRAGCFVTAWFLFGLLLLWMIGPVGAGTIWLLSVPILMALFFGYAGVGLGIGAMVIVAVGFWLLLPMHQAGGPSVAGPTWDVGSWLASSATLIFLGALLSLSIARLLEGLEQSLEELSASNRRISDMLAEREALQEELLLSQKQSALGMLASGIAHDFNNILVPILMASEEARDQAPPNSHQRENLDRVIASAMRARNLVRRILDFSRVPSVDRRPIEVEQVLREVGALLRSSAPAGIDIAYRIEAPDAHVMADPGELHQMLMNLGTNAYLAMKEGGGTLTLGLRRTGDGLIRINVEDTGPGIPPELHQRVFDPFFTTRGTGGTGLGLSIVHRLVTAMGGVVTLESTPGEGTRFSLTLREVEPELGTELVRAADGPSSGSRTDAAGPWRVLIVDDEDMVRVLISTILTRAGYVVRETASPESALRQVHDEPEGVDLVITDHAMPGMSGLKLSESLRSIRPDLPIILISGHLVDEERQRAAAVSIDGVLDKPFSRRNVLDLVAAVLARGHHGPGDPGPDGSRPAGG